MYKDIMGGFKVRSVCDDSERDAVIDAVFIDAGTRHVRLQACARDGSICYDRVVPSNSDLGGLLSMPGFSGDNAVGAGPSRYFLTGKLAAAVKQRLGSGTQILPSAAFWTAAQDLIGLPENAAVDSLAIIDLSASGYLIIGVDRSGKLKDDLLLTNPRCGAGTGINLDRVLQKLDLAHGQVDELLGPYLGEAGRARREATTVRVDRCGVFSTSATISDKNQGIPLDAALATTLKSEVEKTVHKLPAGFDKVYLTGRIFRWRYACDCAEDLLRSQDVAAVAYDPENTQLLKSMSNLVTRIGTDNLAQPDSRLQRSSEPETFPAFAELRASYQADGLYHRLPDKALAECSPASLARCALILALDVGSTMAKAVLADAGTGEILFLDAFSNAGDTITTVKKLFEKLQDLGIKRLPLQSVGITGSARYQVQQALASIYPDLAGRIQVLVENYAHARGSIDYARHHVKLLRERGVENIDQELCILVDIGGEDTKISTIVLNEAELFDNAMNTKCSAGTGSLMDTLSAMFGLNSVAEAQALAYGAPRSFGINATCAVFLMENASKLQAQGVPREEILASANWAIVENMARTLWRQLDLPAHAVVLLHGQTMLSDPLPLAVTHRLRAYLGADVHALLPPNPGHRACIGLVRSLQQAAVPGVFDTCLQDLLDAHFARRVIQCKGKVCGDPQARCNRCALRWQGDDGRKIAFTVGGCTAINELISHKGRKQAKQPRDTYREIWEFFDSHHPHSEDPRRLVIPRSFVVSEWAYFLSRIFTTLGIPVHVDNVRDADLAAAQPQFNVDCCAPQMGAVGQYQRLAREAHGIILAPQIECLPTGGASSGLTCTTNQGGVAIARSLALDASPGARFHLFHFRIDELDAGLLCDQFRRELAPVFNYYEIDPDVEALQAVVASAIDYHLQLRRNAADFATKLAEEALDQGHQVALVVGREYVLNPGIYDSHIRRLLRDRQMAVIPSYVLDVDLDPEYDHIYWRNPHFILTVLQAVAHRNLHTRLRHPGLRSLFQRIEKDSSGRMLPVVQVSTFSCGPDSIITHYVAEIMKQRPFLLLQSDAVLKELAHLENRVNTYVMQLEQGLHDKLGIDSQRPFEIRMLDELVSSAPLNPETDVLCLPTLGDNRAVTAVLRAAGYTCLENYTDEAYDLQALVKNGRRDAGQQVCAPLAAVYSDLKNGVDEFTRRMQAGDPVFAGKRRLVLIDSQGPGPCRQGQYPGLHRLFFQRSTTDVADDSGCNNLPGGALFEFLLLEENEGYRGDFPDWVMLRIYQGLILKGVLQGILFKTGSACRNYDEYQRMMQDYRLLQNRIYALLQDYTGPGSVGRWLLRVFDRHPVAGLPIKYFVYRMHGREFVRPLKHFVRRWMDPQSAHRDRLEILVSGEGYLRLAQAEEIFRVLLGELGFRRFELEVSPALSFLELLIEEAGERYRDTLQSILARQSRTGNANADASEASRERQKLRGVGLLRFMLRKVLAGPLYRASGLEMPMPAEQVIQASRELLPTYRPIGELAPYLGEALAELRQGVDIVLNVAPNGCMVSTMGEILTPCIMHAAGVGPGRIQTLLSAEGDIDEEALTLAVLKATGPLRYYRRRDPGIAGVSHVKTGDPPGLPPGIRGGN
ncbi:MAG: acyl-CoA dehydratase activase-related protein [Gammaproteobacteria bacterium]|nr:acyl-CoA dehydratase activase-related protein [Gammaproteobacteria bacterium]